MIIVFYMVSFKGSTVFSWDSVKKFDVSDRNLQS